MKKAYKFVWMLPFFTSCVTQTKTVSAEGPGQAQDGQEKPTAEVETPKGEAVVSQAESVSYVYNPNHGKCEAAPDTADALLDRVREKAGNECFNLIATDLGFTRVMCPQTQIQFIISPSKENCLLGPKEQIPDYTTLAYADVKNIKAPTLQQMASFKMKVLRGPLAMYRFHTGAFPKDQNGLNALVQNAEQSNAWQGPYIEDEKGFIDPWNSPITYQTYDDGKRYKLISLGPDKTLGTADDQEFVPYK